MTVLTGGKNPWLTANRWSVRMKQMKRSPTTLLKNNFAWKISLISEGAHTNCSNSGSYSTIFVKKKKLIHNFLNFVCQGKSLNSKFNIYQMHIEQVHGRKLLRLRQMCSGKARKILSFTHPKEKYVWVIS